MPRGQMYADTLPGQESAVDDVRDRVTQTPDHQQMEDRHRRNEDDEARHRPRRPSRSPPPPPPPPPPPARLSAEELNRLARAQARITAQQSLIQETRTLLEAQVRSMMIPLISLGLM